MLGREQIYFCIIEVTAFLRFEFTFVGNSCFQVRYQRVLATSLSEMETLLVFMKFSCFWNLMGKYMACKIIFKRHLLTLTDPLEDYLWMGRDRNLLYCSGQSLEGSI